MDNFFNKAPEIIREAAKSTLGVISLIIIALSLVALTFFATASENVRVAIFVLIFIGTSLFLASLLRLVRVEKSESSFQAPSIVDAHNEPNPKTQTIDEYLSGTIQKYNALENIYTNLPVSVAPQIPTEFFPTFLDTGSFQVLIERSMGQEYRTIERIRFGSIKEVMKKHPHIVLLGDPGSGKTVAIWKIAVDYAKRFLDYNEIKSFIPILIQLGQYDGAVRFYEWLLKHGDTIPNFSERQKDGTLIFLLDGLNEMPRVNSQEAIQDLHKFIEENNSSSFVVTCRRNDYDESLGLQQVEIESLDKKHIKQFIKGYLKIDDDTQNLFHILVSDSKLVELASNAWNLKLIVSLYNAIGDKFPRNRSKLIRGFVGALFAREKAKNKSLSFSEKEFLKAIGTLAFTIQNEVEKGTSVEKDWAVQQLVACFSQLAIGEIIDFAKNMGVLEITESTLRFHHQLMQEYFASLELDNFIVDENLHFKYWGKTGWEEVTIMLAGVKDDASELVNAIAKLNPVLAARCVSEGMASVKSETRRDITEKLVRTIENLADNIKERISAGIVIGEFDDPRFQKLPSPRNFVIVPPTIKIPEDTYLIGRDKSVSSSYSDETPQHPIRIDKYEIGKYSITNAEFEGFIKDNGYDKKEFWSGEGWAWRQGKIDNELKTWLIDGYRKVRRQVLEEVERLEPSRSEDSEEMDVWWKILMEWSDDRCEIEFEKIFFEQNCHPHNEPHYWRDPFFNGKKQPVIATWFEAQAYCRWLSTTLNKKYRLPTEAEWEASAGNSTLQYIWGNEPDSTKFNILPTGVMRTTPIGIFSSGASKYGVNDLLGNVWEWTSSAKFPYPYNNVDGREKSFLPDCRRIVRGGSWAVSPSSARIPCRGNFPPDNMVRNYIGFRVVCES